MSAKKEGPLFVTGTRGVSRVRIFKHRKSERYVLEWYVKIPGHDRPKPVTCSLGDARLAEAKQAATKKADELYARHLNGESADTGSATVPAGAKAFREYMVSRPLTIDWLMHLFIEARKKEGIERPLYHQVRARLNALLDGTQLLVEELDNQAISEYIHKRRLGGIVVSSSSAERSGGGTRTLRPVRNRAIDEDLTVIRSAIHWAVTVKIDRHMRLLMDRPIAKWPDLEEKNVRRPIVNREEAEKLIGQAWEL